LPCEGFLLVLEGSVRVAKTSPNGREIVLYRVSPGEACILSGGRLLSATAYSARGVAETDATLLCIPAHLF
jgi:CRP/FNR family transcriptional regulator